MTATNANSRIKNDDDENRKRKMPAINADGRIRNDGHEGRDAKLVV